MRAGIVSSSLMRTHRRRDFTAGEYIGDPNADLNELALAQQHLKNAKARLARVQAKIQANAQRTAKLQAEGKLLPWPE